MYYTSFDYDEYIYLIKDNVFKPGPLLLKHTYFRIRGAMYIHKKEVNYKINF